MHINPRATLATNTVFLSASPFPLSSYFLLCMFVSNVVNNNSPVAVNIY